MSTASKPSYRDSPGEETYHRSSIFCGHRDLLKWCIGPRSHQGGLKTRATTFMDPVEKRLPQEEQRLLSKYKGPPFKPRAETKTLANTQGNPGGLGQKWPLGNKKRSPI